MPPFQPFAASWSRSERRDDLPRTPEPALDGDAQPPSPQRPRFRVKRRNVSNLNAPTQQFLPWLAATDLPIPSIEEPRVLDEEMADTMYPISQLSDMPLTPHAHGGSDRMFSPPKAPALGVLPSLSIDSTLSSLESSPDYESSQPSTSHSTHTGTSLLSYFSIRSEELSQCVSPETQHADHFSELSSAEDNDKTTKAATREVSRERLRQAPWTKPMIQHLWSTYMMYLQDPKVTPFLIGKSGVPPHGDCLRVAWEAKRSWKGSKAQANADQTSGSIIPTAQGPSGPYVQWPHTCAATRAQLRELCKMDARTNARSNQYLAPSPTQGKSAARFWTRRSAPARSPSVFSGQDMAMSLAVSTSDSKQLYGPLAQLTSSHPDPQPDELRPPPPNVETLAPIAGIEPLESERTQLASPFAARSYGPSSSTSLPSSFIVDVKLQRRTHTGGSLRTLMSPVRLARGRSTQKRRPKRPSLGSELWVDPASIGDISSTNEHAHLHEDQPRVSIEEIEKVFAPRKNLQEFFEASQPPIADQNTLATSINEATPRLSSPFSFGGSSFSFPNRLSHVFGLDREASHRPFATVQQSSDNNASVTRASLASRLAYIDERLKDFRRRDQPRWRSDSPP